MSEHRLVAAPAPRGLLGRNRWLLARRAVQFGILGLFLCGPLTGVWIVRGTLASSVTLDVLPLTDPLVLLQSFLAGHWPEASAILGAVLVLAFYLLVGGRTYCAWVCPVNPVTDAAAWLRRRLGLRGGVRVPRHTRWWILAAVLIASFVSGTIAWEFLNPITLIYRAALFTAGATWFTVLALFLLDTLVAEHTWCGRLCPVGAFYGLIGRLSLLRVNAVRREACDDCGDCIAVCPEPQILPPALHRGDSVLRTGLCTGCARCMDVCSKHVFGFATRLHGSAAPREKRSVTQPLQGAAS